MIDHGTTCVGEPCTCSCYTRHVPLPGVHQDTPHPKSQCMSAWQEGYQQGKADAHSLTPEYLSAEYRAKLQDEAGTHCPPYCTTHNHEEMGG